MKDKPAFPETVKFKRQDGVKIFRSKGMTLREYYAGLAMQGTLARLSGQTIIPVQIAEVSRMIADALIAELQKEQGE